MIADEHQRVLTAVATCFCSSEMPAEFRFASHSAIARVYALLARAAFLQATISSSV